MKRPPYRQMILDVLATKKTMTQEDILSTIVIPESTLSRWMTKLIDEKVARIAFWSQRAAQKSRAHYSASEGKHYAKPNKTRQDNIRAARYRRYHDRVRAAKAQLKEANHVPLAQTLSVFMGGQLPADLAQEDGRGAQQPVHIDP